MAAPPSFEVFGTNNAALFSLKIFRGEGMVLLGMDWKNDQRPPDNFAGFGIEYQTPGSTQFTPVKNRLSFLKPDGTVNDAASSSLQSPVQKFRWAHFPFDADQPGDFTYRVTPVFMDGEGNLSQGDMQQASIQLMGETYPGELNVAFTRGFVSSQAFIDNFAPNGEADLMKIMPSSANAGLKFTSSNQNALAWMGFEARTAILKVLDDAIADPTAQVRAAAYDLNEPEIVDRLVQLKNRVQVIIDNSGSHGVSGSAEDQATDMLTTSAGANNVQRQHMGDLQHNKFIAVNGNNVQAVVFGSTNFSWRGFFIQNNNALIVYGPTAVQAGFQAFHNLWNNPDNPAGFGATTSAGWNDLKLQDVDAQVSFSPHSSQNALLQKIADDISTTSSSLFYSLAFLYQTPGPILKSITDITGNSNIFVYGISDKNVGGLDLQKPDGNKPIAFPGALLKNVPEPFKTEASGGAGIHMHHKFVVIDFDKPTARVYMGSYNFSSSADTKNGENLVLIKDRRVAVSYMIEAVTMFDHYEYRDVQQKATAQGTKLCLQTPPRNPGDKPWFDEDFTNPQKMRDRKLFSQQ